jgi:hypothetical protein
MENMLKNEQISYTNPEAALDATVRETVCLWNVQL